MRFGKVAILIAIAAAALRCSGNTPVSEPGQAPLTAPSVVVIHGIDHTATPSGTEVILHGNYPFSYTSYQPDPKTLVLELLDVRVQGVSDTVTIGTPQVQGMRVSTVESVDGGTIAKFEFQNVVASQHAIRLDGNDLVIDFPTFGETGNTPEPQMVAHEISVGEESAGSPDESVTSSTGSAAPAGTTAPQGDAALEPLPSAEQSAAPATTGAPSKELQPVGQNPASPPATTPAAETTPPAAIHGPEPVHVERGPVPVGTAARILLAVEAKGSDSDTAVLLKADGALMQEHFELKNPPRLVIDLLGVVDKTSTKSLQIGSGFLSRVRVAQFATRPRPVARVVLDMSSPRPYAIVPTEGGLVVDFSEAAVRHAQENAPARDTAQTVAPLAAETPATTDATASTAATTAEPGHPGDSLAAAPPAPIDENAAPDEGSEAAPKKTTSPLLANGDARVMPPRREVAFKSVADARGDVVISQGGRFGSRAISDNGPRYTGKRISLNFKDADLKDVFRLFHEITGYNIVLDPAVAGTLTIVLENVPEDQALDIILKNNGLDKVFENNVIRIATSQKLAAEAASRKALIEAQELEEEPVTFTRGLSYAKAKDVTPILKKIMSKRGDVIMDDRTNTLIITDLKHKVDPINRLIDTLDEQTPQVVIEARIVETDREFERDLGITWGMKGKATSATGTQTRLQFPHNATVNYDVNLPSPARGAGSVLGIGFGNVLDTFTLNATLDAFETNGDVKVLSSPRIATQNNQKAMIEQGVQIPVVSTTATQINVEFISASLKLAVTPQITKEGTVIMDVSVDNSSPDFVNRVGEVPPIITERATTQILVADGGTAVIGGIFKLNDSITQASVPGFSKIPGLGWLFRNKTINRKNTELLIFITPRITKKTEPQEDRS